MDLTTYSGLQAAIADFLDRSTLTAQIPGFIALCEAQLKREAKLRRQEVGITMNTDNIALPGVIRELTSLRPDTTSPSDDAPLVICTPTQLADHRTVWTAPGKPRFASLVGNTLYVVPAPDTSYTFVATYRPALTPLSDAAPTNEILADAPDAYLYGSLVAASAFLEHDARTAMWQAAYTSAVRSLNIAREREEHAASPQPMRLPVVFG